MSNVTSLNFKITSAYSGVGLDAARADLAKFRAELKALSRQRININVNLDANTAKLRKDVAGIKGLRADVGLDVRESELRSRVKEIKGLKVKVDLEADIDRFKSRIRAINDLSAKVKTDDSSGVKRNAGVDDGRDSNRSANKNAERASLDAFREQKRRLSAFGNGVKNVEMRVQLDTVQALAKIAAVQMEAQRKRAEMRLDVNTRSANASLSKLYTFMKSKEKWDFSVNLNTMRAEAKIQALKLLGGDIKFKADIDTAGAKAAIASMRASANSGKVETSFKPVNSGIQPYRTREAPVRARLEGEQAVAAKLGILARTRNVLLRVRTQGGEGIKTLFSSLNQVSTGGASLMQLGAAMAKVTHLARYATLAVAALVAGVLVLGQAAIAVAALLQGALVGGLVAVGMAAMVMAKKVKQANADAVASATKAVSSAQRGVANAQRGVDAAIANQAKTAAAGVRQIADAQRSVVDAGKNVGKSVADQARTAASGVRQIADAQRAVQDSARAVSDAINSQSKTAASGIRSIAQAERSAEDAAQGVTSAEKKHANAVKDAAKARQKLNDAIQESRRDYEDLRAELEDSSMNEQAAINAVARAYDDFNKLGQDGEPVSMLDISEAQNNIDQAVDRLEDVRRNNQRLAEDVAKADEKGIEGSDKVVAAKEAVAAADEAASESAKDVTKAKRDQADANQAVVDATTEAAQANAAAAQSVTDAQRDQADAEQNLALTTADVAQANIDASEAVVSAKQAEADAQRDLQQTYIDVADANKAATEAVTDAQDQLTAANEQLAEATRELTRAQEKQNGAMAQAVDYLLAITAPMRDALSSAVGPLKQKMDELKPVLTDTFANAAPHVGELVRMLGGFTSSILPGLNASLKESGPLVTGMADGMTIFGGKLGEMFAGFGKGAEGLGQSWRVMGAGFGDFFKGIGDFAANYGQVAATSLENSFKGVNGLINGLMSGSGKMMEGAAGGTSVWMSTFIGLGKFFDEIGPKLGTFFTALSNMLGPNIEKLAESLGKLVSAGLGGWTPILQILTPVLNIFVNVLTGFVNAIPPWVLEWFVRIVALMKLYSIAVGVVTAVKVAYIAVMTSFNLGLVLMGIRVAVAAAAHYAYAAALFVASGASTVFSVAVGVVRGALTLLAAHPIMLFFVVLIGVIVLIATKTTWFQTIWAGLKVAFDAFMNFIGVFCSWISERWSTFWNTLKAVIEIYMTVIKMYWSAVWDSIKFVVVTIWNSIQAAWDVFWAVIKGAFDIWVGVISTLWQGLWDGIKIVAEVIWGLIQTTWNTFWGIIRGVFDAFVGLFTGDWGRFWDGIKAVGEAIWNGIKAAWDIFWNGVKATIDLFIGIVSGIWNAFWNGIKSTAESIWNTISDTFNKFKDNFVGVIEGLKTKAAEAWNGIKKIFAEPINFVIGIWNDHIADKIGMGDKKLNKIEGYADGGLIPGAGHGRADDRLARVSSGEFVVNARATSRIGVDNLNRLNQGANADGLMSHVSGYKDGGLIDKGKDFLFGKDGSEYENRMMAAHKYAQDMSGQPYDMGGSPPGPTDCSGFMAGIADILLGGNGAGRRWSTVDFPATQGNTNVAGGQRWMGGLGQGFSIGVSGGPGSGGANGHTAGTLTGVGPYKTVNVESGSGHGPLYGGNSLGADSPSFSTQWHLPIAEGKFESGGLFGSIGGVVREALINVFKRFVDPVIDKIPDPFMAGMGKELGGIPKGFAKHVVNLVGDWISQHDSAPSMGGVIPEGERLKLLEEALKITGTPPPGTKEEWLAGMNTLIQRESNWQTGAVNNDDINAQNGNNSRGLAQVVPTTFEAYKQPGYNNLDAALDNIMASINYIKKDPKYGNITDVQQANANMPPKGYAAGTDNARPGWNLVGENGPELVEFKGGEQVIPNSEINEQDFGAKLNKAVEAQKGKAEKASTDFLKANFDQFTSDLLGGGVEEGFLGQLVKQSISYSQQLEAHNRSKSSGDVHYHVTDNDDLLRKQKQQQKEEAISYGF